MFKPPMAFKCGLQVYDRDEGAFLQEFFAAFILVGGKSARMGADKAFIQFGASTLLARALEVTRAVSTEVRIVGAPEKFAAFAPVVEDIFQECGPLGGIHAALRVSQAELNLMLAVDVPYVLPALLQYLVKRSRDSDAIVTVPRADGLLQPLCAVYRRNFADTAESALRTGRYKIGDLFRELKVQVVEEMELAAAGFSREMFCNLNTPEELAAAQHAERRS